MKTKITLNILIFCLMTTGIVAQELKNSRPNIILVLTDDQGMGEFSCMGHPIVKTPHIDSFYTRSTRFTDFQVSPTCSPTRAALMSGRRPFEVGVSHTIYQRERMALNIFTMPQMLQSAGYETAIFGKWHLGDEETYLPTNRGFDEALIHGAGGIGQTKYGDFPPNEDNVYFDNILLHNDTIVKTKGFCTDLFFQAAISWIKMKEESGNPYFCYLSLNAPHSPYVAPDDYKKRFLDEGYSDNTAGRYGMIENIDDNFGILIEELEKWNALDNTLLIFMTDNGMSFTTVTQNGKETSAFNANLRGTKNSPHEGGTHVPCFWYWKNVLGEGVDIDGLTAHIDLYKTFSELAGATLPDTVQDLSGISLLPLLEDPEAEWPDRKLFIHTGRWKPNERDNAKYTKCAVRTQQWRFVENSMLFDISNDPSETTDVSASHPELTDSLSLLYNNWWDFTDSLLINEGLPTVDPEDQPLALRYYQQLNSIGIPEWEPIPVIEASVSLTIKAIDEDSGLPLSEVVLILNKDTLQTETNGEVLFTNLEAQTNYAYVLSKDGYESIEGNLKITKDSTLTISMTAIVSGISEDLDKIINIYPNPVTNFLEIESLNMITNIRVYSSLGQLMDNFENTNHSFRINTQNYPKGMYLLHLKLENQTLIQFRFVISNSIK